MSPDGSRARDRPAAAPARSVGELTPLDDYPFHQAISPFPIPSTSDSHFNDGYYFGFYRDGFFGYVGLRLHPNNNVMDGYAGAVISGEQRTVRVSRALRPGVGTLAVGPLRLTILEPMVRQRLELGANPTGLLLDVEFVASGAAFFESPDIHYRHGRLFNHVLRYTQLCRVRGSVSVDGDESEVDGWYGNRDHSWGIRASMGPHVPIHGLDAAQRDPRAIRIWMPFEVDDHVGFFSLHEDVDGNVLDFDGVLRFANGRETELVAARHDFRYFEGTTRLRSGTLTLVGRDGSEHDYAIEVIAGPSSPQAYGYVRGWQDGGQPGVWRGAEWIESDSFRIDEPGVSGGPLHVPAEQRMAPCEYPARIVGPNGATGMTQVEHMVYSAYRPYGFG